MPALPKPHRIAVLVPSVTIEEPANEALVVPCDVSRKTVVVLAAAALPVANAATAANAVSAATAAAATQSRFRFMY